MLSSPFVLRILDGSVATVLAPALDATPPPVQVGEFADVTSHCDAPDRATVRVVSATIRPFDELREEEFVRAGFDGRAHFICHSREREETMPAQVWVVEVSPAERPGVGAALVFVPPTAPHSAPYKPKSVALSSVVPVEVPWLWYPWAAMGKLTTFDADPMQKKTFVLLDLAARVSAGRPMPGTSVARPPGNVLLIAEDGKADTLRPRLDAAGADARRVHVLEDISGRPPDLLLDAAALENEIAALGVELLIVDPLGPHLRAASYQASYRALWILATIAERLGTAVVVARHLTKSGRGGALRAALGSMGVVGAVRSAAVIANDPEDERYSVLAQAKNKLAPLATSLRFRLESAGSTARVVWDGTSDLSADELLAGGAAPERRSVLREARSFLAQTLLKGPMPTTMLKQSAVKQGFAWRTIERAKAQMRIKADKIAEGWVWRMLDDAEPHEPKTAIQDGGGLDGLSPE